MWFASMIVAEAPAPAIVSGLAMSRSPVWFRSSPVPARVRSYFPAGRRTVFAPLPAEHSPAPGVAVSVFAAVIASRSEQ